MERRSDIYAALLEEMRVRRSYLNTKKLDTVYLGGGTPSLLPVTYIQGILDEARSLWDMAPNVEITMEANPDDLSMEYLRGLATTGINRLSIGVQSFIDRDLLFMGRRHNAVSATGSVLAARNAGFKNISIDLIYGIPGMTLEEWKRNIEQAIILDVEHISAYCLTVESDTPLHGRLRSGEFRLPDDSIIEAQYLLLRHMLTDAGFEHYELSNFARPGYRSKHNTSYWRGEPYLGIGPSAHSYNGTSRSWSPASLKEYLAAPGKVVTEQLTEQDIYNEYLMTRLRTSDGIDANELKVLAGDDRHQDFLRTADRMVSSGNLERYGSRYRLHPDKYLLSDGIIREFFDVD